MERIVNEFCIEDLKEAFAFIEKHVHLGKPNAKNAFLNLSFNSQNFVNQYLIYNLDRLPLNLNFLNMPGQFKKKKKRNQEINKILFKSALRKLRREFNPMQCHFIVNNKNSKLAKYLKKQNIGFYIWMFMDSIIKKQEHPDFILDVCLEKYGPKTIKFSREMNWNNAQNKTNGWKAMKNISGTFRYLVKRDKRCRRKFMEFLQSTEEDGLLCIYQEKIQRMVREKFKRFKNELISVDNDFDRFIERIELIMDNKNYKSPWVLNEIKNSIALCVNELEYDFFELKKMGKYRDIRKDYLKMKQLHYTSTD
jgi:ribosomal protein S15P/S13E